MAEIRCFYSADGKRWHDAGPVFDGGALGQRQWAGSALYDDGEVYLYYTAAGDEAADEMTYTQRIAVAHGGTASADEDGIELSGPWTHETLLTPDGEWYETEAQSRGMTYTFRDPWFFEDSATGETHLLFEANAPAPERPGDDEATAHRREFNGCVGVAVSESGDPLSWELRPPLLDAVEVNQELERPHVVVADGRYYLFVCSHVHTFAPGVTGPDGLYGFVADALDGEYRPLNGSGLVATNPPEAPFQAYSWMAFAHDEEVLVQSFLNYYDFAGDSLDAIADLPRRPSSASGSAGRSPRPSDSRSTATAPGCAERSTRGVFPPRTSRYRRPTIRNSRAATRSAVGSERRRERRRVRRGPSGAVDSEGDNSLGDAETGDDGGSHGYLFKISSRPRTRESDAAGERSDRSVSRGFGELNPIGSDAWTETSGCRVVEGFT